ncbi:MAG: hypothetical protein EA423_02640 [Phycisphaerales bacterium]|nr:MAG: hypothetical protein EA423_02640 [Phycisphaerales bacterium]
MNQPKTIPPELRNAMTRARPPLSLAIEPGTIDDYRSLAHTHYAKAEPALRALVLRAVDARRGSLAGVLVVSFPTLNGAWRKHAWPELFAANDRKLAARRVNTLVRRISRVIVDPRYRGCGVGRRLVRAYLDNPLTDLTEAVASMGALCPVFERAQMRRVHTPTPARDETLRRALDERAITPERLLRASAPRLLGRDPSLGEHLLRWANASRATRKLTAGSPANIAPIAAAALLAPKAVFVCGTTRGGPDDRKHARRR